MRLVTCVFVNGRLSPAADWEQDKELSLVVLFSVGGL